MTSLGERWSSKLDIEPGAISFRGAESSDVRSPPL